MLIHHADLLADLDGRMRQLASRLSISVPAGRWPELVDAATFAQMQTRAEDLVPDEQLGLFSDKRAFFNSGKPQQWRALFTDDDERDYATLLRSLGPPEFIQWLEKGELWLTAPA